MCKSSFSCFTNVFSPFLYNQSLFLVYSRCYTELWGQRAKFLYTFLLPFWSNVPDFARNCFLRRQDNKFSFIFNLIIWQSYYTIGHWTVFQSSLTDLWSQNSVDSHCGQSQVTRGMKPPPVSISSSYIALIPRDAWTVLCGLPRRDSLHMSHGLCAMYCGIALSEEYGQ